MSANPFETLTSTPRINEIVENVLLITLNEENPRKLFVMNDGSGVQQWTTESIEMSLFERVMALSFEGGKDNKVILYLYNSYIRLNNEIRVNKSSDVSEILSSLIFRNIATALKQPELFPEQNIPEQLLGIFKDNEIYETGVSEKFLSFAIQKALEDADDDMKQNVTEIVFKCFDECLKSVRQATMISLDQWILAFLMAFSDKNPAGANLFLDYIALPPGCDGIKFADSLLGQLLSLSMTPKNNQGPYEYYDNLHNTNMSALSNLSSSLWNYLKMLQDSLHLFVKGFLVIGGETRDKLLRWIGNAISSNTKRGQIWTTHSSMILGNFTTAPDSFMVGLTGVLLRLCLPLTRPQLKVLIVDPTYAAVKAEEADQKQVHIRDFDKETCLIPFEENEARITANKYNFVTEIFFMTQKAIDLSFRVCIEKVTRMNREIHRLQSAYQDAMASGGTSDVAENIMTTLTKTSQQLLCLQNLILEPKNDELLVQFFEATAIWVNQLAIRASLNPADAEKGYAPQSMQEVRLPLSNNTEPSKFLQYVPEMILENIIGYLQFSKNFDTQARHNHSAKEVFITMILIFMGSCKRAKNPHLRANLAEGLESLLPRESNGFTMDSQLFHQHPHRLQIVENLLDVFVSIEMTGQSVQFEQKFNYRRPMYAIMEFLWKIDEQRECFNKLSLEAQIHVDDAEAPIFLRFINVLINDSIFLLDESLTNLQQIREMEEARDQKEWESLPSNERQQNLQNLQQIGMLARFDNILGRDTINILKLLTSETKGIFCHSSMVDRIASMLNYFLLQLCGPKQKNFKVKNKEKFDFDPANTVKQICSVYLNLKDNDDFCLAITQDGRSYSPELFKYAENTLIKISGGDLIAEIIELSAKVHEIKQQQKLNDEVYVNPPGDFLDPLVYNIMNDPVILPSSNISVDRSTISRYLLSNQTDPFNRSPLTMSEVIPNVELKAKIDEWMREKLQAYNESNN